MLAILSLMCTFASAIFWLDAPVNDEFDDVFDFLYFAVTTFTTVGYGDYSPTTVASRVVVIVGMSIGIGWLPSQLSNLSNAMAAPRTTLGSLPSDGTPFLLLVGDVLQEQLTLFLRTHFNGPHHRGHVVVLTPHPPAAYDLPELSSAQRSRVTLVQGDILDVAAIPKQVAGINLRLARRVFIFSNPRAPNIVDEDRATTVRLLSVAKRVPPSCIHVQYKLFNNVSIARDLGVREVVCLNHLKMRLLSRSCCDCMGVVTLLSNLVNSGLQLRKEVVQMKLTKADKRAARRMDVHEMTRAREGRAGQPRRKRSKAVLGNSGAAPAQHAGSWQREYAEGADEDMVVRPLPLGLHGMPFSAAAEVVFARTGALLIALLDVSSFADPFLTPWSMVIEIPTHHGVWIGSASSLRTTYEAFSLPPKRLAFLTPYAEGRARRRTSIIRQMSGGQNKSPALGSVESSAPKAGPLGRSATKSTFGLGGAGSVAAARKIQGWLRGRHSPNLSEKEAALGTSFDPSGEGSGGIVLVLGWPRNLAQLVRSLSLAGLRCHVLAPSEAGHTKASKITKLKGAKFVQGSPLVRDDLKSAGIGDAALRTVLIFKEGLFKRDEDGGGAQGGEMGAGSSYAKGGGATGGLHDNRAEVMRDHHCMVVAAKVRGTLGDSARTVELIVEVSSYASFLQVDPSSWWPHNLSYMEAYLLAPVYSSGCAYTDALMLPLMLGGFKEGLISVVQLLLETRHDLPQLLLRPLPPELGALWSRNSPPTYAHLVRACLERHWMPLGPLRARSADYETAFGGPRRESFADDAGGPGVFAHKTSGYVVTNPPGDTPLNLSDRVFVILRPNERIAAPHLQSGVGQAAAGETPDPEGGGTGVDAIRLEEERAAAAEKAEARRAARAAEKAEVERAAARAILLKLGKSANDVRKELSVTDAFAAASSGSSGNNSPYARGALTEASGLGEGSSRTPRRNSLSVRGSMRREASTRAAYDEDANSGSDFSDAAERVSETSKPGDETPAVRA